MKQHGAFNTNRPYTRMGQRIGWAIVKKEYDDFESHDPELEYFPELDIYSVVFYDVDRLITGKITVLGPVTAEKVLAEYDNGRYQYPTHELREYLDLANNEARNHD